MLQKCWSMALDSFAGQNNNDHLTLSSFLTERIFIHFFLKTMNNRIFSLCLTSKLYKLHGLCSQHKVGFSSSVNLFHGVSGYIVTEYFTFSQNFPFTIRGWLICHALFQANLRKFMDHVHHLSVEKITKMLDRGLDPNYHDLESGGQNNKSSSVA